jgi:Ca2+-binding EF-hand superfamily protein
MSPANGLRALRIALVRLDHNKNGLCEPVEFKYGLRAFGIDISEDESALLLKNFDPSRSGKLSVNELMHILRGESLNEKRCGIVIAAYNSLDYSGNQCVTIADLENAYDVSPNPEFVYKTKTGDQIMKEFLQVWDTNARDGIVS